MSCIFLQFLLIYVVVVLPSHTWGAAGGLQFFLAEDGSDSWDGTSPVHLNGTSIGPWKHLSNAIASIRNQRPLYPDADNIFIKQTHSVEVHTDLRLICAVIGHRQVPV